MIKPPKQKLLADCTQEEVDQFVSDSIFLLAHAQLVVEQLDSISNVKSIW